MKKAKTASASNNTWKAWVMSSTSTRLACWSPTTSASSPSSSRPISSSSRSTSSISRTTRNPTATAANSNTALHNVPPSSAEATIHTSVLMKRNVTNSNSIGIARVANGNSSSRLSNECRSAHFEISLNWSARPA